MRETMTIAELAARLGKSRNTIRVYMHRRPEALPPWFKTEGASTPLWFRDVVDAYLVKHAKKYRATLEQFQGGLKPRQPKASKQRGRKS